MIIYDLTCTCGYLFEGWFQDRQEYNDQLREGLIHCPVCDGSNVHKVLSPVAQVTHGSTSVTTNKASSLYEPVKTPTEKDVKEFISKLSTFVKDNYEDVGSKLAEKALKMHYGVEEEKRIRGVATPQEEKMLEDEGIELVKLPVPLEEENDDEH